MALTMRICCGLLFISGVVSEGTCQRDAICEAADEVEDPVLLRHFTNSSDVWVKDESVGYLTDGYIVALTGRLEWLQVGDYEGTILGAGQTVGQQYPDRVIGRIGGDFCPTYNAVFTTTNKEGLVCNIKISKLSNDSESNPKGYCNIVLQSWSISLLYFRPADEAFFSVANIKVYNGAGATFEDKLEFRYSNGSNTEYFALGKLFFVQLDGITYIRAKALTTVILGPDSPETTTTTTTPAPGGRRLLASGDGMDYAPEIVTAADFLSSLPRFQVALLGLCIGSSVFAGQVLLSYTQSFKN